MEVGGLTPPKEMLYVFSTNNQLMVGRRGCPDGALGAVGYDMGQGWPLPSYEGF